MPVREISEYIYRSNLIDLVSLNKIGRLQPIWWSYRVIMMTVEWQIKFELYEEDK